MVAPRVDIESKRRKRLRVDIDKHRFIYRTFEVDSDSNTSVLINFVSPSIFIYETFRFYLLKNSVLKELDTKYYFRPDYLSYDEYCTTVIWTMILYINGISNIESFINIEKLYIPTMDAIYRVADNSLNGTPLNVTPDISLSNRSSAQLYTKKSKPTLVEQPEFVPVENKDDFYYMRQTMSITNAIASRQYVDLNFDAVPQSITFKIKDKSAFLYDRDYVLINDSGGKPRRVTWDKRQVSGDGLLDVIEEGMILEIQYAKKL